jgi:GAF domain-containing protein
MQGTSTTTEQRSVRYSEVLQQAEALFAAETDTVARMANMAALLHRAFGFHWVGFYRVQGGELVLGPFQGPVACTRIAHGKGVCGAAWAQGRTQCVPDVHAFPGHIACSAASRSELVVPVYDASGACIGVLDIDSERPDDFGDDDIRGAEALCALFSRPG